jgi:hypothetical protein
MADFPIPRICAASRPLLKFCSSNGSYSSCAFQDVI